MTYARAHLVDKENGGFYHCTSRCVRRGWLCGFDAVSGRSFAHRRAWIESRLLMLAEVFAVDLYGYAIMSNHYHAVVHVRPRVVDGWRDEEVVRRWLRLSPSRDAESEARKRRVEHAGRDPTPLAPLSALGFTLPEYVALLSWTAATDAGGVATPAPPAARALNRLSSPPQDWLAQVGAHRFKYRAYGALSRLQQYVETLGQKWIKGAKQPGTATA